MIKKPIARALTVLLSGLMTMTLTIPSAAWGDEVSDLQAQLDQASARLEELGNQVMAAGEDLNETQVQLEQTQSQIGDTEAQIAQKEVELDENQAILSDRVSSEYKSGPLSLLSVVLDSTSIEDFVSNVYYLNKLNEQNVATIGAVNQARTELGQKKAELESLKSSQEELVSQKAQQLNDLNNEQAEQQSYVDSLSEEVKRALEEKRQRELEEQRRKAEEAARKAAEEAARQAAAEAAQAQAQAQAQSEAEEEAAKARAKAEAEAQQNQNQSQNVTNPSEDGAGAGESNDSDNSVNDAYNDAFDETFDQAYDDYYEEYQDQAASGGSTQAPTVSSGSGLSASQRQTILNAAFSQLGVPYSWGACSPGVAFDCSGFTSYCYGQAGISIPHSAASQGGILTPVSELQPGDLIVWLGGMNAGSGNHVALYAGDGMIIHANWGGVEYVSLAGWRSYSVCGYIA